MTAASNSESRKREAERAEQAAQDAQEIAQAPASPSVAQESTDDLLGPQIGVQRLDLDALTAVAEAADRCLLSATCDEPTHHWFLKGELIARFSDGDDEPFEFGPDVDFIAALSPATVLALIAEAREARAEAIRENAQMLSVQDDLNEALDSICEHKAAIADMRRRKETAEAELERLRGEVAALADEWEHGPDVGYDRNEQVELDVEKAHARTLRALIGGGR